MCPGDCKRVLGWQYTSVSTMLVKSGSGCFATVFLIYTQSCEISFLGTCKQTLSLVPTLLPTRLPPPYTLSDRIKVIRAWLLPGALREVSFQLLPASAGCQCALACSSISPVGTSDMAVPSGCLCFHSLSSTLSRICHWFMDPS